MATAHTYVNFAGNTEEAFQFYRSVFGGEFTMVVRFADMGDMTSNIPEADEDKIMHIGLYIGKNNMLMGTDSLESLGQKLVQGNNTYVYLEADDRSEAERLYSGLSKDGQIEMELQQVPWAERYGSFKDRFGLQWMVAYTGDVQFGQ